MSALDFGGGSGSNSWTRRYAFALPALPNADWSIGFWVRLTTIPGAGVYPTILQNDDGVQGTTGGMLVQFDGDNDGSFFAQVQSAGGSATGPGTGPLTYNGHDALCIVQRRGSNYEVYVCDEGGSAGSASTAAVSGTTIAADGWSLGWDWRNALGEFFMLSGDSLTAAEVTELATGKQITEIGKTPVVHFPLRDGAVATEPNLGSGGSANDATRDGTGYSEVGDFFALGPPPQELAPDADVSDGAWTPSTGSDLYAVLDEAPASDADYISVNSNSECEISLADGYPPDTGDQTLTYRAAGSAAKALVVGLYQDASLVEQWTVDPLQLAVTEYVRTLATPLSDLTGLTVRVKTQDAASPPATEATWGAIGSVAEGTNTCAPSFPSGITAGQYLFCLATGRHNTANTAHTAPAGWTKVGEFEGGTGTWAADTGTRRATVFQKDTVTGSESGTITIGWNAGNNAANTIQASIIRVTVPTGYSLNVAWASGADTSNGTGYSAASSGNVSLAPGDLVVTLTAQNLDTGTGSSRNLSASGITFGTLTNRADTATTQGNDHRHVVNSRPVTSGTATTTLTHSYTISASGSGPTGFLRLRAVPPTEFARFTSLGFEAPQGAPVVELAGAAAAQASAAAALSIAKALAAAAVADAAAAATLSKAIALAASAAAQAAAGGELAIAIPLAGAAAGQASGSGQLTKTVWLAGAAAGQADADGEISQAVPLAGAAGGAAAASGALSLEVHLLGAAIAQASADASLTVSGSLHGAAVALAAASGALSLSVGLAGAALAQASAAGSIELAVRLAGAAAAAAQVEGTLFLSVPLQGAAAAVAQAGGAIALTVRLDAAAQALGAASGAVTVTVQLAGDAGALAQASGQLLVFAAGFEAARGLLARPAPRRWRVATRQPRRWRAPPAPRRFTAAPRSAR